MRKLIEECIKLLGDSGFHVHAVTSDGAQWNRGVWNLMGIKGENTFCKHPYYDFSKLWFIGDFPHLIKCLRNILMLCEQFWVNLS